MKYFTKLYALQFHQYLFNKKCRVDFVRRNLFIMEQNEAGISSMIQTEDSTTSDGKSKGNKTGKQPKDQHEIPSLRHLKYRKKTAGKLPPPGLIDLQVVGCGKRGTPKAFLVNMDHFKYLFNCGEGLQRIVTEHRMKMTRIENIFFTHQSWDNIGGLMGMCLSMDAAKVPKVTIHGPSSVEALVTTSRGFSQMYNLNVEKHELDETFYEDSAMRIEYVRLLPQVEKSVAESKMDIEHTGQENVAVSYICKPHPRQRSISFERIVDLKIPRDRTIGLLKDGKDITLDDGRTIRAEDVLEPSIPNHPFFVVECPDESYLKSLCEHSAWQTHKEESGNRDQLPQIIVHLTSEKIMDTVEYKRWMTDFGEDTHHLVLNDGGSEVCQEGLYDIQAKLNLLHDHVFPFLPHQIKPESYRPKISVNDKVMYGETNLRYFYRSRKEHGYDRSACVTLRNQVYQDEVMKQCDFPEVLQLAQKKINEKKVQVSNMAEYPEIVFLGTGSTMPNKVRNVSAILIHLSSEQAMLLDCGENTMGQLWRHYGDETPELMSKIDAIYLSHLHADHHMGVVGFLMERKKILKKAGQDVTPLLLLAPSAMAGWWESMDKAVLPVEHLIRLIPNEYFTRKLKSQRLEEYNTVLNILNLKEFGTVPVRHRQHPFGVALTHKDGWKVAYSGDTMPCDNFVKLGSGCDILLHEATMEDELKDEAKDRNHSTTSQAIDIGIRMKADFILLTHFSQRYAKVPIFNEQFSDRVGIAFDNMKVRPCDLKVLPFFTPVLKEMFADVYAEMEEKTTKRKRRKKNDDT